MLTVVIQAGGESRRMGQDKGLAPFLGATLVERVQNRVAGLSPDLLVTSNHPDQYAFLGKPVFPDRLPGRGALGGLYTALSAASQPLVAVVACDMPFVSVELLAYGRDLLLAEESLAAAIPLPGGGTEPFHAVYRKDACLPAIEQALQADRWRVDAWFAQVKLRFILPAEIEARTDPDLVFRNVNTPEELREAEQTALALET